ncbi:aldehyde dehydrogenase (NADP(+)) [Saccharopolyspora karakumensis]|uniref:Aldehyde dehydrogenase (NADP(+)) n=1 Tax=Saccharopolyspora karakumensis TaxID=2530386 RepID=A0A4R5BT33_9PSEU|nr:aldehyde dehydrogenase (NADP(+)) [Saccharopolyspora karakumensis]TDD89189.1 aldehyde dehydrogenase (NADP(+)) [Saccharopolyspora karakumensis]
MTTLNTEISETTEEELDRCLQAAADAAESWGDLAPKERAAALETVADALDDETSALVEQAAAETGLSEGRLTGEVKRTTVQLRMFADLLRDGSYLRIVIDRQDPDFVLGARPDLRRWLTPTGPVVVYAASNFPFAFSVAGGDTASALAAGCPVVLKTHPGHPETSRRTVEIVRSALTRAGAPEGTFAAIAGRQAGIRALQDPRITAGAFTGSVSGGRALFDIAAARPNPIPFFGELGSINPAVVTSEADHEREEDVAAGFVGSFTLGAGQFCTKPGVLLLPGGSELPKQIAELAGEVSAARMLTAKIADGYRERIAEVSELPGVEVITTGTEHAADGDVPAFTPTVLHAGSVANLLEHRAALLEETFGPAAVIAEYESEGDLHRALSAVEGSLTVTLQTSGEPGPAEQDRLANLVALAGKRAGRVIFNQWPTGVAVTPAQQHGGPYPATTAVSHTSVGTAAIDRFLRPVSYQNCPEALLPAALRDANPLGLPRTVNEAGEAPGTSPKHD